MRNVLNGLSSTQGFKAAVLVILTLVMLIPISMVKSLITERSWRADEVRADISSAAGGELQFGGPVIRIPGSRRIEKKYVSSDGNVNTEYSFEDFSLWYAPQELEIDISLETENKFRGIFGSPVFSGRIELNGRFAQPDFEEDTGDNEQIHPEQAEIIIPFFNQKGIRKIVRADWSGTETELQPGSRGLGLSDTGIFGSVSLNSEQSGGDSGQLPFSISIDIRGAGKVGFLPLAGSTRAGMAADWPAPSFGGFCLPDSHNIGEQDFTAVWSCSSLSTGLPVKWDDETTFDQYRVAESYINTEFIDVVDHYKLNERAAKYAILFILVPFITLFMFEHFFSRRLHILQYILAGTANIIFYLLLLSISEHLSFNLAYLISAASVITMLCLYTYSMLGKDRKALCIAPVMTAVYCFLFVTLQSEDWALLIGSIGVFVITAVIMFATRKIDFYRSRQNRK